jgi:hypothetical protein
MSSIQIADIARDGSVTHPDPVEERRGEEFLYRFEAQLTFQPLGIVPEGLRMANSFEGVVTQGVYESARIWGIDHLLVRRDGVSVIDAQKAISLGDRHIYEHVHGYCLPPAGMEVPPLEATLDPGFAWPDVPFPIVASSTFRTADPALAYLNRAVSRIEGWASFATGSLVIETWLMPHSGRVAMPMGAVR